MTANKMNLMSLFTVFILFPLLLTAIQNACWSDNQSDSEGNEDLKIYHAILRDSSGTMKALSAKEQQYLYDLVEAGSVTSIRALGKYDPEHQTGFCFGRAMAVHLMARRMGLREESIRKLFVVGCLGSGGKTEWRFHVATMVKGDDGAWHALEMNVAKGPLSAPEWVREMHRVWDPEQKARLYVTSPSWVLPDVRTFRDLSEEKGTELIELSFDPSHREGFRCCSNYGVELVEIDDCNARRYFIGTDEEKQDSFDFGKIVINGEIYRYRGYFDDMLKGLKEMKLQEQTCVPAGTQLGDDTVDAETMGKVFHACRNSIGTGFHACREIRSWKKQTGNCSKREEHHNGIAGRSIFSGDLRPMGS